MSTKYRFVNSELTTEVMQSPSDIHDKPMRDTNQTIILENYYHNHSPQAFFRRAKFIMSDNFFHDFCSIG